MLQMTRSLEDQLVKLAIDNVLKNVGRCSCSNARNVQELINKSCERLESMVKVWISKFLHNFIENTT